MSQAKVDKYKEFKKNRKEELEKERKAKKRTEWIWKGIGIALAAALVVALAITGWNAFDNWKQARPIYTRDELIISDIAGISATEEETTEAPENNAEESGDAQNESANAPAEASAEADQGPQADSAPAN